MANRERRKGVGGELEVAAIFRTVGFDCDRVPNSGGLKIKGDLLGDVPAHLEVKRQEVARPWAWWEQAAGEAPAGAMPVVAFRRSRSPWLAIVDLEQLAQLMAAAGTAGRAADRDTFGEQACRRRAAATQDGRRVTRVCVYCGYPAHASGIACRCHADLVRLDPHYGRPPTPPPTPPPPPPRRAREGGRRR